MYWVEYLLHIVEINEMKMTFMLLVEQLVFRSSGRYQSSKD